MNRSDPKWVALKKFLGPAEYKRLLTGPEAVVGGASRGWGDKKLAAKLIGVFNDEVRPAYQDLVAAFAEGPDSEGFESAMDAVEAAVDAFDAARSAWEPTADAHVRSDRTAGRSGPAAKSTPGTKMSDKEYDSWLHAGQPDRAGFGSGHPGPGASKEEYDNWLYSGGR